MDRGRPAWMRPGPRPTWTRTRRANICDADPHSAIEVEAMQQESADTAEALLRSKAYAIETFPQDLHSTYNLK